MKVAKMLFVAVVAGLVFSAVSIAPPASAQVGRWYGYGNSGYGNFGCQGVSSGCVTTRVITNYLGLNAYDLAGSIYGLDRFRSYNIYPYNFPYTLYGMYPYGFPYSYGFMY